MSFTLAQPSDELAEAIVYAEDESVVCVAAAGNTARRFDVHAMRQMGFPYYSVGRPAHEQIQQKGAEEGGLAVAI